MTVVERTVVVWNPFLFSSFSPAVGLCNRSSLDDDPFSQIIFLHLDDKMSRSPLVLAGRHRNRKFKFCWGGLWGGFFKKRNDWPITFGQDTWKTARAGRRTENGRAIKSGHWKKRRYASCDEQINSMLIQLGIIVFKATWGENASAFCCTRAQSPTRWPFAGWRQRRLEKINKNK